jgi:hypothetical protein
VREITDLLTVLKIDVHVRLRMGGSLFLAAAPSSTDRLLPRPCLLVPAAAVESGSVAVAVLAAVVFLAV